MSSRDMSRSLKAQKQIENTSKSKFDRVKESIHPAYKEPMIKLTATISRSDWDYLQSETIKRSQERGKILTISHVLREILEENRN